MRRKNKKAKSLKFYVVLMMSLLGVYLVLVMILSIRNPVQNRETESSAGTPEVQETATMTWEESLEEIASGMTPSDAAVTETGEQSSVFDPDDGIIISDYGRGGKQYTIMQAQDVFTKVNVTVSNEEELRRIVGVSMDQVKSCLNIYATHHGIDAAACRMTDYSYVGELGERVEIRMQYDDVEGSQVIVIFEPATSAHSSHVDVVPDPGYAAGGFRGFP